MIKGENNQGEKLWYAIYVRSRHEKNVHSALLNKDIESFLPVKTVIRQWSDRKKKVEVPLFRGYVFIRIDIREDKFNILKTDGVVKFIGIGKNPSRIPDEQIHWMHIIVEKSDTVKNEKEIPIGQKVSVIAGPFKGLEGIVTRDGNQSRLVIVIESILNAVSVEISPDYLEKIKKQHNL